MSSENLFYIGRFGETIQENDEGVMLKDAELFSVGTHRGVDYTEDDLKVLMDNFSEDEEVPIQIDHSDSALHTVGYLKEVSMSDGKLLGKLQIIDDNVQARVNKKLMKKLSISFYLKKTANGIKPYKLREVSLVAFPQVKTARLFSENGYVSDYEEEIQMSDENKTIDTEDLKAQLRADIEAEMKQEFNLLVSRLEKLEGVEEQLKETQIEDKVTKLSEQSKVVPAQADSLSKLLASFSEAQAQLFDEFMSNAQKIDFDEQGQVDQQDGSDDSEKLSDDEKFYQEYVAKYGKSL